jgi:hypothetical protein
MSNSLPHPSSTAGGHPPRTPCAGVVAATSAAVILLALAGAAGAAGLKKCVIDGAVTFTDGACPDQSAGEPIEATAPILGNAEDVERVRRQAEDLWLYRQAPSTDAAAEAAAGPAGAMPRPTQREITNAIRRRQVLEGMTEAEVRRSMGPPSRTTRDVDGDAVWTYAGQDSDDNRRHRRIHFDGGHVHDWTETVVPAEQTFEVDRDRWLK